MAHRVLPVFLFMFAAAGMAGAAAGHSIIALLTRIGAVDGPYATYRHEAIVPAIVAAGAIVCVFAASVAIESVAHAVRLERSRIVSAAACIRRAPPIAIWSYTLAIELTALCGAETFEQTHQFGHPLGFFASLGAAPFFSLALYACLAAAFSFLAVRAIDTICEACRGLACAVVPFLRRALMDPSRNDAPILAQVARISNRRVRITPLALRIANRPPPLPIV